MEEWDEKMRILIRQFRERLGIHHHIRMQGGTFDRVGICIPALHSRTGRFVRFRVLFSGENVICGVEDQILGFFKSGRDFTIPQPVFNAICKAAYDFLFLDEIQREYNGRLFSTLPSSAPSDGDGASSSSAPAAQDTRAFFSVMQRFVDILSRSPEAREALGEHGSVLDEIAALLRRHVDH